MKGQNLPKPRKKAITFFFLVLLALNPAFVFSGANKELTVRRRLTMAHFGTVSQIVVYDDFSRRTAVQNWDNCWEEIKALLTDLETKLSSEIPEGDIGRFNALKAGESIVISNETAEVFLLAKELYEISGGAFNPAVYLLADLWGFTPRFMLPVQSRPIMPYDRQSSPSSSLPDEQYIRAFTELADFNNCIIETTNDGRYMLTKAGNDITVEGISYSLKLDFGGIGKGYAADKVGSLLKRYGYTYGLVNIGSSSFQLLGYYGEHNKTMDEHSGLWPVNIRSPFDRSNTYLTAYGKNEAISTSGTYDNYYVIDTRRYSHIIDTKTGYPANEDIVSATIIGGNAAWGDAVTTALCIMPLEEARRFMEEQLQNYQVILILGDGSLLSNTSRYQLIPP